MPLDDQHIALNLLLEFSLQKGTLSSILDIVLLLLNLWEKRIQMNDNRSVSDANTNAPLLPFIKRFMEIQPQQSTFTQTNNIKDESDEKMTCTKVFLEFLELPEDDANEIDLKQAAVFVMSHLDVLAEPHIPPASFNKVILTNIFI